MRRHLSPRLITLGFALLAISPQERVSGENLASTEWSPRASATYLDGRAGEWLEWSFASRGQGTVCLSCHTTMPFILARPALSRLLGETAPDEVEKKIIRSVQKRVEDWNAIVADPTSDANPLISFFANARKPSALGTESVLNAFVLVQHDAQWANGKLNDSTRKALGHLWGQQQENGAWLWLDFDDWPWAKDGTYYGASLAAIAVGRAGEAYHAQPDLKAKSASLTKYLRSQLPNQWLHNKVMVLWASSQLPGILTDDEKKSLIEVILKSQEEDGGWALPRLGEKGSGMTFWKTQGGDPEGTINDGYSTGLVVLALKRAGVAADQRSLKKGMAWLVSKQKDGVWPATYLNKARDPQTNVGKFMRDAATAFAVLGLTEDN